MSDVELYISRFSPEIQSRLLYIRAAGFEAFANAEEKIYHGVPAFMCNGRDIFNYGVYKNHVTLYIGYGMTDLFKKIYPQFNYTKAAMQIPHADPFPKEIIREILELKAGGYE
jgi:uncharacterized protein YdhG (YjbR/CyaY superfamily)